MLRSSGQGSESVITGYTLYTIQSVITGYILYTIQELLPLCSLLPAGATLVLTLHDA